MRTALDLRTPVGVPQAERSGQAVAYTGRTSKGLSDASLWRLPRGLGFANKTACMELRGCCVASKGPRCRTGSGVLGTAGRHTDMDFVQNGKMP